MYWLYLPPKLHRWDALLFILLMTVDAVEIESSACLSSLHHHLCVFKLIFVHYIFVQKCVNDFILVDADMVCLWKLSIIFQVALIEYTNN